MDPDYLQPPKSLELTLRRIQELCKALRDYEGEVDVFDEGSQWRIRIHHCEWDGQLVGSGPTLLEAATAILDTLQVQARERIAKLQSAAAQP